MSKFSRLIVDGEWRGLSDENGEPVVRISGEKLLLQHVDPHTYAKIHKPKVIKEQVHEGLESLQPAGDLEQHQSGTGQEQE